MGTNFVVVPVQTELQRAFLPEYNDAFACVVIFALPLVGDDDQVLDMRALDFDRIGKIIEEWPEETRVRQRLVLYFLNRTPPAGQPPQHAASSALSAYSSVFFRRFTPKVSVNSAYDKEWTPARWRELRDRFSSETVAADAERNVGNNQVKVFAVESSLGRVFANGADCVIQIIPPIEDAPADSVLQMRDAVDNLTLQRSDTLLFMLHWNDAATARAYEEQYCSQDVARQLGFKRAAVRLAPFQFEASTQRQP